MIDELDNIIEDLGFQHSDRDGNMSGIQWKQFAIDLLSATPATKQGTVAEQFESWWSSPDAPNGQHYEKDIAKQAWVASSLYRYTPTQPSPSESDTELSRAMEYALEEIRESLDDLTIKNLSQVATGIRDLKEKIAAPTQPVQPSDTEIPSLTTDRIANIVRDHLTAVYSCTRVWSAWSYGTMGPDDFVEASETELAEEIAESIKAAMQAQEGL